MKNTATSWLGKLSFTALVAVLFLVFVGGLVRSTGSGMGCPDWPKCFGSFVPPTDSAQLPDDYSSAYNQYRKMFDFNDDAIAKVDFNSTYF